MRMLMRVSLATEKANEAIRNGTLQTTIQKILAEVKPEAAYFMADDAGNRMGAIVFDMQDSSQIPGLAEPWFLAFDAKVTFRPVMTPQDLGAAAPGIEKAVKEFGNGSKFSNT
jgi:hypothetical protein